MVGTTAVVVTCVVVLNVLVDPFNRTTRFEFGLPKATVSFPMNYQLYKLFEFARDPKPTIVVGDSRANSLKDEMFVRAGLDTVYNFSYGGGTLYEALDTIVLAARYTTLEKVIIGVPFNLYNESNNTNRLGPAVEVGRSAAAYYLSSLVTKASVFNLLTHLSGRAVRTEAPSISRLEFWDYQITTTTRGYYGGWQQPVLLRQKLEEIVAFCAEQEIELVFFIPPGHVDLQDVVVETYGLAEEYARFKDELAALGRVIDFDVRSDLTTRTDNFKDPYHFTDEIAQVIVDVLVDDPVHDTDAFRVRAAR